MVSKDEIINSFEKLHIALENVHDLIKKIPTTNDISKKTSTNDNNVVDTKRVKPHFNLIKLSNVENQNINSDTIIFETTRNCEQLKLFGKIMEEGHGFKSNYNCKQASDYSSICTLKFENNI